MAEPNATKPDESPEQARARVDRFLRNFGFAPKPGSETMGFEEMIIEQRLKGLWNEWFPSLEDLKSRTDDFVIMLRSDAFLSPSGLSSIGMAGELYYTAMREALAFRLLTDALESARENGYRIPKWGNDLLALAATAARSG